MHGRNVCGESPASNLITLASRRLQASGPIKMSDVNKALNRAMNNANSSLKDQVQSADNQVSKSQPFKLSSFLNYCY